MQGQVFFVHAVDTEGPLYESITETFQRVRETFNVNVEPSKENLIKLQNQDIDCGGKESTIADMVKDDRINYNSSWDQIDEMHETIMSNNASTFPPQTPLV